MTRSRWIWAAAAAAAYLALRFLPLPADFTPQAPAMLAAIVASVIIWMSGQFELYAGAFLFVCLSVLSGAVSFNDVSAAIGSSALLAMIGMFIVAMGADRTNISRRIGFFFLAKFGNSPGKIILSLGAATIIVSSCCSNLAVTVVMASIAFGILKEIGEQPGTSTLGKTFMLALPVFSAIGGLALVNGAPGPNSMSIHTLSSVTEGRCAVSYGQWAVIGILSALILVLPVYLLYTKWFMRASDSARSVDRAIFRQKLTELGPLSGPELRWILTVAAMVVCFFLNRWAMGLVAVLFALITVAPVIGTVEPKYAITHLPWSVLIMSCILSLIGTMFSTSGMGGWIARTLSSRLGALPPFVMMLLLVFLYTLINNLLCNANIGLIVIYITAFSPIIMACGYNPAMILMPVMMTTSCTLALGAQSAMVLTYDYGYWTMKDPVLPGFLISFAIAFAVSVVVWFAGPLIGIPLYLS